MLIDEIDKADLDFPNDLLWELDQMEFSVPEAPGLGHSASTLRPFVVITHNEEKPLPPAFLRRCVYYYVEFPKTHDGDRAHPKPARCQASPVKEVHGADRRAAKKDLNKKPGLTELIDWVRYEEARGATPDELANLPDIEAVLKDRADIERVRKDLAVT